MKIFLIGFTGVGKTTIGREVARRLNFKFIDLDEEIAKHEEDTVSNIFIQKGERYFRQIEYDVLIKNINSDIKDKIISTGGGIVEYELSRRALKNEITIFLQCEHSLIEKRMEKLMDRPMFMISNWKERFDIRAEYYEKIAHYTVPISLEIEQNVFKVMEFIQLYASISV